MKVRFYSVEKYVDSNNIIKVDREEYVELRGEYTCDEAQEICDEYNEKYSGHMEYEVVPEKKSFKCEDVRVSFTGEKYKVCCVGGVCIFEYDTLRDCVFDFVNLANSHEHYLKFVKKIKDVFGVTVRNGEYVWGEEYDL